MVGGDGGWCLYLVNFFFPLPFVLRPDILFQNSSIQMKVGDWVKAAFAFMIEK